MSAYLLLNMPVISGRTKRIVNVMLMGYKGEMQRDLR